MIQNSGGGFTPISGTWTKMTWRAGLLTRAPTCAWLPHSPRGLASSQLGSSRALYASILLDKADTKSLVLTHSVTPTTLHWLKQSKAHPDSRGSGYHLLMEKDRSLCTGACEMAAIVIVVFGKIESSTRRKKCQSDSKCTLFITWVDNWQEKLSWNQLLISRRDKYFIQITDNNSSDNDSNEIL